MAVTFGRRGGTPGAKGRVGSQNDAGRRSGGALEALLQEEQQRELRSAELRGCVPVAPRQPCRAGDRPKIYMEVAIFRGSFFGVDYQSVLEFELWPERALEWARRLLHACAAGRLRDRAFLSITEDCAALRLQDEQPEYDATEEVSRGSKKNNDQDRKGPTADELGVLLVPRGKPKSDPTSAGDTDHVLLSLRPAPHLNRNNLAVARLLRGSEFLAKISGCRAEGSGPIREARVVDCGEALDSNTVAGNHPPQESRSSPSSEKKVRKDQNKNLDRSRSSRRNRKSPRGRRRRRSSSS